MEIVDIFNKMADTEFQVTRAECIFTGRHQCAVLTHESLIIGKRTFDLSNIRINAQNVDCMGMQSAPMLKMEMSYHEENLIINLIDIRSLFPKILKTCMEKCVIRRILGVRLYNDDINLKKSIAHFTDLKQALQKRNHLLKGARSAMENALPADFDAAIYLIKELTVLSSGHFNIKIHFFRNELILLNHLLQRIEFCRLLISRSVGLPILSQGDVIEAKIKILKSTVWDPEKSVVENAPIFYHAPQYLAPIPHQFALNCLTFVIVILELFNSLIMDIPSTVIGLNWIKPKMQEIVDTCLAISSVEINPDKSSAFCNLVSTQIRIVNARSVAVIESVCSFMRPKFNGGEILMANCVWFMKCTLVTYSKAEPMPNKILANFCRSVRVLVEYKRSEPLSMKSFSDWGCTKNEARFFELFMSDFKYEMGTNSSAYSIIKNNQILIDQLLINYPGKGVMDMTIFDVNI